jgi:hypothetical protein
VGSRVRDQMTSDAQNALEAGRISSASRWMWLSGIGCIVFLNGVVPVFADIAVTGDAARDYALPEMFGLSGAQYQQGPAGTTLISNTSGNAESSFCTVIIASDDEASALDYAYKSGPTQCVSVAPHPEGGFFVRGVDPSGEPGDVVGFTSRIGADGAELWEVSDERLTTARAEPEGTGEFIGAYNSPSQVMAYSERFDKLLAFTVGLLKLGIDDRPVTQAHVVNAESGQLRVSGQTFGQSGVGVVAGTAVQSDGNFVLYYFSSGVQGAIFYTYNGRESISFFEPGGENWETRIVSQMVTYDDKIYLLWTPNDAEDAATHVTVTTVDGAQLWSNSWPAEYTQVDGNQINLGPPLLMWVGADLVIVLHQVQLEEGAEYFLRAMDRNGESLGAGSMQAVWGDFNPLQVVKGTDDRLKLLTFDSDNNRIHEFWLTIEDLPDYDPDQFEDMGEGAVDLPALADVEITIEDVAKAAGCCATFAQPRRTSGPVAAVLFMLCVMMSTRRWRKE